jgi:hypothetical protein
VLSLHIHPDLEWAMHVSFALFIEHATRWYARPEWWLVLVGFFTLALIFWQAKKTAEATEAMHKNITLQFRPRLEVRAMVLTSGDYVPVAGQSLEQEADGEWKIEYIVANVGGTSAYITESNLTLIVQEGESPAFPPYNDQHDSLGSFSVKPGEHVRRAMTLRDEDDMWRFRMLRQQVQGGATGTGNLLCLGFLQYRDEIGTSRRTAFCRRYEARTERFDRINNSHHEYID